MTNTMPERAGREDPVYRAALAELRRVLSRCESGPDAEVQRIIGSRDQVLGRFQPVFGSARIAELGEEDFRAFLRFENNRHWTGIGRHVGSITADMQRLRATLSLLLDESVPLRDRVAAVLSAGGTARVRGLAKAIATPILLVAYPDRYGVWNSPSEQAMRALGIWPSAGRGSSEGEQYTRVNEVLGRVAGDLGVDLWTLDALWWRVSRGDGATRLTEEDFEEAVQTTEEIDADTPLETRREVALRTEQRFIRQQMFGTEAQAKCAICGKPYPVEFLRAAHVKRRAECTPEEKRDFRQNVVPMCTFGCDELFERGWIIVQRGRVAKGRVGVLSEPVAAYIRSIEGRECLPYYRGGGEYFDWHARAHGGSEC